MPGEPMVIHTVPSLALARGGPSYAVTSLANAQVQQLRGRIHLICRSEPQNETLRPSPDVQLHALSGNSLQAFIDTRRLLRSLSAGDVVLHDNGIWHPQNLAVAGFAARNGLSYVINTHGMLAPWALNYRPFRKRAARVLYQDHLLRHANCLVATSQQELHDIRRLGLDNPIALIPNGIDVDIPPLSRLAPAQPRTALFLSRIHPVKGLIHAIEAWHRLRPERWQLKIVGPSEARHRGELEAMVQRLNLTGLVSFHDAVSGQAKYQCYHDADLFVLPTYSENFGVVVAEALACGLPVITTTGTPWRELTDRRCGWYVDTGTEPLVNALRQALHLPDDELREMGKRGRQWVQQTFRWEQLATQSIELYAWVMDRGARPSFVY